MDLNSSLFDSIRIKPVCDEPKRASEPACNRPGCKGAGLFRAPMGRDREGQYFRFCKEHVKEYNASYNYFAGMSDDAVAAYQKDALIGHRPTWQSGDRVSGRRKRDGAPISEEFDYVDPLGILHPADGRPSRKAAEPPKPRRPAPILKALDTLGLDENADSAAIKAQYKILVKRFHPDAHRGDRSFEDRLRDIIQAHGVLKTAGLC